MNGTRQGIVVVLLLLCGGFFKQCASVFCGWWCVQLRDKDILGRDLGRAKPGGMLKMFFGVEGVLLKHVFECAAIPVDGAPASSAARWSGHICCPLPPLPSSPHSQSFLSSTHSLCLSLSLFSLSLAHTCSVLSAGCWCMAIAGKNTLSLDTFLNYVKSVRVRNAHVVNLCVCGSGGRTG